MTKLVVVTEFPGKTDLVTGKLLTGETGRLFWELIDQAGIPPSEIEVLSVLSSRPGSGKIEDWCLSKKEAEGMALAEGYPNYPFSFIKAGKYLHPKYCKEVELLHQRIRAIKPNLVLTLGSFATWALLNSGKRQQRVLSSPARKLSRPTTQLPSSESGLREWWLERIFSRLRGKWNSQR